MSDEVWPCGSRRQSAGPLVDEAGRRT